VSSLSRCLLLGRMTHNLHFSETVFVGESKIDTIRDTLYAIPSYVDDATPTIKRNAKNLLEGPKSKGADTPEGSDRWKRSDRKNYIIFGHYENPSTEQSFDTIGTKDSDKQLSIRPDKSPWHIIDQNDRSTDADDKVIILDNVVKQKNVSVIKGEGIMESNTKNGLLKTSTIKFKHWFDNEENKVLKLLMVILIGVVITMFWYFHTTVRELRQQSENGSNTKIPRSGDSGGSYGVESLDGECRNEIILLNRRRSVVVVDIRLIVDFIHGMIENRLVDDLQMALECSNHNHKVNFDACEETRNL
jgi:serine/threonine-protein kinase/endoribonuclease IRE1